MVNNESELNILKVEESAIAYKISKKIAAFKSLEEQKEDEDNYVTGQTPSERLAETFLLIKKVFWKEYKMNDFSKKINIIPRL